MVRTCLLTLVCLLTLAAPSVAQTNPVAAGQPFTVSWDANPAADNVTVYRCYVDKTKVGSDIPVTSPRRCVVPSQTPGTHVVEVSAVNAWGEGARAALTASAGTPPGPPSGLRIEVTQTATINVAPGGQVTVLASTLEARTVAP